MVKYFANQRGLVYMKRFLVALFYVFITMSFIFSEKIGFGLPFIYAQIIAIFITILSLVYVFKKFKHNKTDKNPDKLL